MKVREILALSDGPAPNKCLQDCLRIVVKKLSDPNNNRLQAAFDDHTQISEMDLEQVIEVLCDAALYDGA